MGVFCHARPGIFQDVDYLSFLGPGTQAFVKRVARIDDVAIAAN